MEPFSDLKTRRNIDQLTYISSEYIRGCWHEDSTCEHSYIVFMHTILVPAPCHVCAVGDAPYCGLVHMLKQAANNLYLMFSYIRVVNEVHSVNIATGDVVKCFIKLHNQNRFYGSISLVHVGSYWTHGQT